MEAGPGTGSAARVRLLRLRRRERVHDAREAVVRVRLGGDLEARDLERTVHALAGQVPFERLEGFGLGLAARLLEEYPVAAGVALELAEKSWVRLMVRGDEGLEPHPHALVRGSAERGTALVEQARGAAAMVTSGLRRLRVLDTAAGVEGADPHGVLAVEVRADWSWAREPEDWAVENSRLRDAMLAVLARGAPSLEALLEPMGRAALERCPAVGRVRLWLTRQPWLEPAAAGGAGADRLYALGPGMRASATSTFTRD